MYTVLLIVHILVALATVLVILMQSSKGNGLDSTLGGAANQVLGGQHAPEMLKKLTRVLVGAFFVICIVLAFQNQTSRSRKASAVQKLRQNQQTTEAQPLDNPAPLEEIPAELPAGDTTSQN